MGRDLDHGTIRVRQQSSKWRDFIDRLGLITIGTTTSTDTGRVFQVIRDVGE